MTLIDRYTKSLLHFNGADASTTFRDESGKTWTAHGDAQIDTAIVKPGFGAGLFDATGDWIDTPDSADFTVGSGNWTVEILFNRAGGNGAVRWMLGQSDSSATSNTRPIGLQLSAANVVVGVIYDGSQKSVTGTTAFTSAGWNHAALVCVSNTVKLFVNGVKEGTDLTSVGTIVDSSNAMSIGRLGEFTTLNWNGSLGEFRFSKGIARWTANFTPPSREYRQHKGPSILA